MADPLPAALKIPEVSRFVNRANQLRSIKPAVAYWCEYHAVNQIVGKSLHTSDEAALAYTTTLIERLETTKAEHAEDESIVDNDVAKAYVEQFAQQTFDRAERTLRADKVTRQTADTFDAAATFFDLLREWGELEPEILQKIKFAKWNAARILKAIREGRDPNESNPKQPEEKDEAALDPSELDVQQLASPKPASVQEVPDTGEPGPSEPPSAPDYFPPGPQQPPSQPYAASPSADQPPSVPASAPGMPPEGPPSFSSQIPPQPSPQIPTKLPSQFIPPPAPPPESSAPPPVWQAPPSQSQPPAVPPQQPAFPPAPAPAPAPVPNAPPPQQHVPAPMHYKDLNKAQKHAKWAISALNFEDVPTAVQELRNALAALGTQ